MKRFNVGDRVKLEGYPDLLLEVVNVYDYNFKHDGLMMIDTFYELRDIISGEGFIGFPEDMELQSDKESCKGDIDAILDKYNNWMSLYELLGDVEYKDRAEKELNLLSSLIKKKDKCE